MTEKLIKVRPAAFSELDDLAAFCAGREHDPTTRELKRGRRQWLEAMVGQGLKLLVAIDPTPPAVIKMGEEKIAREELSLLADGLVVGLLEYAPGEITWYPVDANGYRYVDCLWVIPGYTGRGIGRALLSGVVREARRMESGVAVTAWRGPNPVSTWAYMPARFFRANGFEIVDEDGDRVLMAVSYGLKTKPRLRPVACEPSHPGALHCSPCCPASWRAALEAEKAAVETGRELEVVTVKTREEVQARGFIFGLEHFGTLLLNRMVFRADVEKAFGPGEDDSSTD